MPRRPTDHIPEHPPTRRYPLGSLPHIDARLDARLFSEADPDDEDAFFDRLDSACMYAGQLRWILEVVPHHLRQAEAVLAARGHAPAYDIPDDLLVLIEALSESLERCRSFLDAWAESTTCLLAKAGEGGRPRPARTAPAR